MNTRNLLTTLAICCLLPFMGACSKNDQATAPSSAPAPAAANAVAAPAPAPLPNAPALASDATNAVLTQTKDATVAATHDIQSAASNATQTLTASVDASTNPVAIVPSENASKVQVLITQAKTYIDQNKYPLALDTCKKLDSMNLSPKEKSLVDNLKTQVEKRMASDATKSLGGLLRNDK